ncbi:MAG: hypothetical protein C4523_10585 [Myxococcales bacterium]|nr:MAG: hypothetical protein C4523_10585 [Myxococcales bacterium]
MTDIPKATAIAPTLSAGGRALAIVPQSFDDCYRMGKLLAISGLVPNDYKNNPEGCTVAIMQGLELGLSPMAALQSIAVINGRPSIWGDGALAVVRASGLLEYIKEWTDGTTAYCEVKRAGEPEPIVRTFSDDDAKAAGLLTKKGPWQEYRPRMRQMRARSWALRDGFADVLKGLHIAEEAQDIPMRDVTPQSTRAALPEIPDIPDVPDISTTDEAEPVDLIADEDGFLVAFEEQMREAGGDVVLIQEIWDSNEHMLERLSAGGQRRMLTLKPMSKAAE